MGLESVELVLAIEGEFEVSISDEEAENLLTPRDMGNLIEMKLRSLGRAMPRDRLDEKLKVITIREIGIKDDQYDLDAEYVRDFQMD